MHFAENYLLFDYSYKQTCQFLMNASIQDDTR